MDHSDNHQEHLVIKLSPVAAGLVEPILLSTLKSIQIVYSLLKNKMRDSEADLTDFPTLDIGGNLSNRKITCDVRYLEKLYSDILEEVRKSQTFSVLAKAIKQADAEQESKKEFIALYQGRKWKQKQIEKSDRVGDFQKELQKVEGNIRQEISENDIKLNEIDEQIKEAKSANPQWTQYEEQLIRVQLENLRLHLEEDGQQLEKEIIELNNELPLENRAHESIIYYLETANDKLQNLLRHWKEKQDVESEALRDEIEVWRGKISVEVNSLLELQAESHRYEVMG